jgi:exodeoxyribonuclease VII small subunit
MAEELSFEEALRKLEEQVQVLSDGKLSLQEALENFEEGIKLFKFCNQKLKEAEQKVTELVEGDTGLEEKSME